MAIKPVTYQGVFNFKSNLYALEVKSRFINQTHADGFYKGYGNELNATAVNNVISVGSGAFVIQGRMNEIESGETVEVTIENGKVGYLCARIETYHPSDDDNCILIVKTGATLADIPLTQDDTYSPASETANKIYECPLYSFKMTNGEITNLVKIVKGVEDYAKVNALAQDALTKATNAVNTSNNASTNAINATQTANRAKAQAEASDVTSDNALSMAQDALSRVVEKAGGTVIYEDGIAKATFNVDFIAKACVLAFESVEAEKARGYTKGGEIYDALKKIKNEQSNSFAQLQNSLTVEKTSRTTTDNALKSGLSSEISNRMAADTAIRNELNSGVLITEKANKATADNNGNTIKDTYLMVNKLANADSNYNAKSLSANVSWSISTPSDSANIIIVQGMLTCANKYWVTLVLKRGSFLGYSQSSPALYYIRSVNGETNTSYGFVSLEAEINGNTLSLSGYKINQSTNAYSSATRYASECYFALSSVYEIKNTNK